MPRRGRIGLSGRPEPCQWQSLGAYRSALLILLGGFATTVHITNLGRGGSHWLTAARHAGLRPAWYQLSIARSPCTWIRWTPPFPFPFYPIMWNYLLAPWVSVAVAGSRVFLGANKVKRLRFVNETTFLALPVEELLVSGSGWHSILGDKARYRTGRASSQNCNLATLFQA